MHAKVTTLLLNFALYQIASSFDFSNIVFIIVSQKDPYHSAVAKKLKQDIEDQTQLLDNGKAIVHLTHEDFQVLGDWTIHPLLRPILNKYKGSDVRWTVFLEPHTAVRCAKLVEVLAAADDNLDTQWVGYPLTDEKPTVIHHYDNYEDLNEGWGLAFPNFASGFAMKFELMNKILNKIANASANNFTHYFTIDPAFELAKLIYGERSDPGPLLTPELSFCFYPADNCATYPKPFDICGSPISENSIFFAVSTWSGYHDSRVKIVKKTWGRHVTNILFYSDTTDPALPSIDTGVPNSIRGHCVKTMAILKMAVDRVKNMAHIKWIFLADDDTILGVQRLTEVLSCYRGGSEFTVLGQRYGFDYGKVSGMGYDFITTGAGAAFSVAAAAALSGCTCAYMTAPDDMVLGECARLRNYTLTHSPLFHQCLPHEYSREVIARDRPVSFHHHSSPTEPIKIYASWFQHDDLAIQQRKRDEL